MTEQTLSALLGAMGTALVTAVGGLAWMVRQRSNGHVEKNLPGLSTAIERLTLAVGVNTTAVQALTSITATHTLEATLRASEMLKAMERLERTK